jgi:hypothetical protein
MGKMRNAITKFWSENKGRDHSEDLDVNGMIVLKRIFSEIGWKFVDWMHLAQDKDRWSAVVNTVMNFQVP